MLQVIFKKLTARVSLPNNITAPCYITFQRGRQNMFLNALLVFHNSPKCPATASLSFQPDVTCLSLMQSLKKRLVNQIGHILLHNFFVFSQAAGHPAIRL